MVDLEKIVAFLEEELRTTEIPDYPGAHNGLQLQNTTRKVTKVACAVDASLPVIEKAVSAGADLLLVHHGLFWQGVRPLVGPNYRKIRCAMEGGLAIYSSHIPLDVHPEYGNNVRLSRALDLGSGEPFFDWKGVKLGRRTNFEGTLGDLADRLEGVLGDRPLLRGTETDKAGLVGIITGGAGSEVEAVAGAGINTFITGEGPHWSHSLAEELGLNLFYAGHYATETFGVRALGGLLEKEFGLAKAFIDHPTGL